jgi:hypothetical protein
MIFPWRKTSEARELLALAKKMQSMGKPVTDLKLKCSKLVMEANHALEKFDASKKNRSSFLILSQNLDQKLHRLAVLRSQLDEMDALARSTTGKLNLLQVPQRDYEGIELKRDLLDVARTLSSTVDEFRTKLDDVEIQLEEIREECEAEIRD